MTGLVPCPPGHTVQVTEGVFGRGYVDCECTYTRTLGNLRAANVVALSHVHAVQGKCTCPPEVVALSYHPTVPRSGQSRPVADDDPPGSPEAHLRSTTSQLHFTETSSR